MSARPVDSRTVLVDHAREMLHRDCGYEPAEMARRIGALEYVLAEVLDLIDPEGGETARQIARISKAAGS